MKPARDRGVYRAAANPKSEHHTWAVRLVKNRGTLSGLLDWGYRDRGIFSLKDLIYSDNPFLKLFPKDEAFIGKSIPVPIVYKSK